jgi:hypothetical protein
MKCASLLVMAVILCAARAEAATIQAASCSQPDVAAAINSVSDGDTVVIPAGTCTWSAAVSVNKSITIRGAGVGTTIIRNASAGSGWSPLFNWVTKATGNSPAGLSRLTGLTLDGGTTGGKAPWWGYLVVIRGNSGNLRIDHNQFISSRSRGMAISGYVRGVIDHNTFHVNGFGLYGLVTRHESWANGNESYCAGFSLVPGCGDTSWASPLTPGSRDAIYAEDNTFINGTGSWTGAHDGDYGHRTVFRNNTYRNVTWGNHGLETTGRPRGARWSEHYRNEFVGDNRGAMSSFPSWIGSRSGSHMVFDNRMTFTNGASVVRVFDMATYRAVDTSRRSYYVWGRCGIRPVTLVRSGTTVTATSSWSGVHSSGTTITVSGAGAPFDGTFVATGPGGDTFTYTTSNSGGTSATGLLSAPWDANSNDTGYRCLDQVGAGTGTMITGSYPSPVPGGHQQLEPVYIWNNLRDADTSAGTNYQLSPAAVNGATNVIVQNRDFYNQNTSFTGATGVGRGPIGMRPSSCTSGVAYWATDEGEWDSTNGSAPDGRLYKCMGANNWTLFYTPYRYPHDLVTGDDPDSSATPATPTNLRIVGQ